MTTRRIALSAGVVALAALFADYAYFRGFDNGADASLCVFALQNLPKEEALQERSCKAITGLKPPPRIFPGSNGDEPTVWNTRTPEQSSPYRRGQACPCRSLQ